MKIISDKATNLSSEAFEITKNAANQQKNIRYDKFKLPVYGFDNITLCLGVHRYRTCFMRRMFGVKLCFFACLVKN